MLELFEQKYKECEKQLFLVAIGYLHNTVKSKLSRGKEKLKNAIMQNGRFYNE